ncbi:YggT family protein [Microbulbifer hydrolyticus]|uniref:YggT family protein n=1 Tax=Microbulbifer hydrolyticus TaxID=48074 RepID=A0A6P1TI30_9GAMM|nr:YggT family protein [Microbulbifer hydrolyticus]MBB5211940.1 YggT family protein [Microbulbifer hydrolyticus]QHQ40482.1 YggT family protein [Microbulbifer hydrolyticus]
MVNTFSNIGVFILATIGILFLFAVLLRFLMQVGRADFYNPLSQGIVKVTNPFLRPLRKIVPGLFGIDMASLVLALLVGWVMIIGAGFLAGAGLLNPLSALLWSLLGVLMTLIAILFVGMLISIVVSWVAPQSTHPALMLLRQVLEPVYAPVRKIIPPLGVIDISPIFVFILLTVADKLLVGFAQSAHMPQLVYNLFWHIPF